MANEIQNSASRHIPKYADADRITIFPILLVNFIGTLGYSIVLPFLVILVLKLGGNELIYGILGATYSFFQLLGAPILGNWSDRYGRKKILLLSQIGTFLAWVLFLIALLIPNQELMDIQSTMLGAFILTIPLLLLFAARALDGITGGNVSVANAYLADVTPEEDRKRNFGKMGASANLGFIVGPALAGVLGETALGEMLPVLLALFISLIAIFVISFYLQETNPCVIAKPIGEESIKKVLGQEHKECYKLTGENKAGFRDILKLPNIPFMLLLYFLVFLAFSLFYVAFPVHAVQQLDWSLLKLGGFFSVLGFILVIVEGPILTKISGWFSDSQFTIAGSILLAGSFLTFMSSSEFIIGVGVVLYAVGNGIMWPSFLSILSKTAEQKFQGAVQGYASSTGSLASIIGLITGGFMYSIVGPGAFLIPGLVLFLIFLLSFKLAGIEKSVSN